jgi:hypothetical protein
LLCDVLLQTHDDLLMPAVIRLIGLTRFIRVIRAIGVIRVIRVIRIIRVICRSALRGQTTCAY